MYVSLHSKSKYMKIESTLISILPLVWEATTVEVAKEILVNHLSGTSVKDRDKMIDDIGKLRTLEAVHKYTANSLLKYEGLGTGV